MYSVVKYTCSRIGSYFFLFLFFTDSTASVTTGLFSKRFV